MTRFFNFTNHKNDLLKRLYIRVFRKVSVKKYFTQTTLHPRVSQSVCEKYLTLKVFLLKLCSS